MEHFTGKLGIIFPTFQEYPNRKNEYDIVPYIIDNDDFRYSADGLIEFYKDKDIDAIVIVNPDNPSGNYIPKKDILKLAKYLADKNIKLIVDESFVDFVDVEDNPTLLEEGILCDNPNLYVVKSISKSFGVPGIRLGILASDDLELIADIKKDVAIWNINSFAEFYLQIYEKYSKNYSTALKKFKSARDKYIKDLSSLDGIRVIPTQANYVTCEITSGKTSTQLAQDLLEKNIFIKDLSTKKGFDGRNYIRIAVKNEEDNDKLIAALKENL